MTPPPEAQDELEKIKRREAWYRLKTVQDFLVRDVQIRAQAKKIESLLAELAERNGYIHRLHLEQVASAKRERVASADLEFFTRRLGVAETEIEAKRKEIAALASAPRESLFSRLRGSRRSVAPAASPAATPGPAVPAGAFIYDFHSSPYRLYRASSFVLRGWTWPKDGAAVVGVRARVGDREFSGRHGLEEPAIIAHFGPQPANPRPGFEVEFATPPGRHRLSLEARTEARGWESILTAPIWCDPAAP
jgi:hypothetical protein